MLALYDAAIALPEGVQILWKSLETPANLPFARKLWVADAASLLGQVDGDCCNRPLPGENL